MTVCTITEIYGDDTSEIVAICKNHASAIQWLIANKGLNKEYLTYQSFSSQCLTYEQLYQENWLNVLLDEHISFFALDNLYYEIEEKELFCETP